MEHRIGPHLLAISGDTVTLTLEGDFLATQIRPLLAHIDNMGGGTGVFYVLADVRRLSSVQPEARRIASGWQGIRRAGGTAIIGATVLTRTLILLVSRASTLLSKTNKTGSVDFFATETEGRAWIAARREAAAR